MMIGIGGGDYSHRYWLQLIPLIIGPITNITDVSISNSKQRWLRGVSCVFHVFEVGHPVLKSHPRTTFYHFVVWFFYG